MIKPNIIIIFIQEIIKIIQIIFSKYWWYLKGKNIGELFIY